MKTVFLCVASLLVAGQAAAVEFTDNSLQNIGERRAGKAIAAVSRHLAAPQTARFRGLYLGTSRHQRGVVCGFVSARDDTGKMVDFQPFIYNPRNNDAMFMPMSDFQKKDIGPINISLYEGIGCGGLLRRQGRI